MNHIKKDNASLQSSFLHPILTPWQRTKLLHKAQQVLNTQHLLFETTGTSILQHTLGTSDRHRSMDHYPSGDRIDYHTGGQYFYHCHRENLDTHEQGHFHCFLRQKAIPKHIRKVAHLNGGSDHSMTHLIAIGMNQQGQPIRLFTLNRWVTDETWYEAKHMKHVIQRFHLNINDQSFWSLIDQWIEGMIHLFAPQIIWLHQQRDTILNTHQRTLDEACHEHRSIEELSTINIHLTEHIQWILDSKQHTSPTEQTCQN